MSQILSRHLKINLGENRILSIPRAQILHLRYWSDRKGLRIDLRLSVGEVSFFGSDLGALWVRLVNGDVREELTAGTDFTACETDLDPELSPSASERQPLARPEAAIP